MIAFPHSSVNVNVTVSVPVAPHKSLKPVLLLVTAAVPQVSVPEKLTNQAANAPLGSAVPSHSTVISAGGVAHTGSVVSSIVKIASCVIAFPLASVNVKVTVSVPVAPQSSESPVLLLVTIGFGQLSVPVKLVNQFVKSVVFPEPSHCTVISAGAFTHVGSISSTTIICVVQEETFPLISVTVSVTSFSPTSAQVKVLGDILIVSIPQLSELPPSISETFIVTCPELSKLTVKPPPEVLEITMSSRFHDETVNTPPLAILNPNRTCSAAFWYAVISKFWLTQLVSSVEDP